MATFRIWCVSIGSMGRREAWLKGIDGAIVEFADKSKAEAEAAELNRSMNSRLLASASYAYGVREV